jgi:hypothetical protein
MKTPLVAFLFLLLAINSHAQYAVVQRDANSRIWERTTYKQAPSGELLPQSTRYTELATGMHYKDPRTGEWVESKEQIEIVTTGGAQAVHGQHQVYFPADIYDGVIELVTPDGKHMKSRPLGISYFDGSNSVFIAELKHSIGQILPSGNQVIYTNAFTDFAADLVLTYRKSGFESDLVFRERPPGPEAFGLNPINSRLELLTEFFEAPEPRETRLKAGKGNGDTTLAFGSMSMIRGKAFQIGSQGESTEGKRDGIPVNKTWAHITGRTFLIEEVADNEMNLKLKALPVPVAAAGLQSASNSVLHKVSASRLLPSSRIAVSSTNTMRLAKVNLNQTPGVVLDYTILNGTTEVLDFQSNATYYFSGDVYYNDTNTVTIEGGAVLKYAHAVGFTIGGRVVCPTNADKPAFLTAMDDDSIGETIQGSTGTPSGFYAAQALKVPAATQTNAIENLRISYADYAMSVSDFSEDEIQVPVRNCQFINCDVAFGWEDQVALENDLFYNVGIVLQYNFTSSACNLTVHGIDTFLSGSLEYLSVTNTLFISVTNFGDSFVDENNATNASDTGIFQTSGAATHYLATSSPYRDLGTTNISADLLAELETMTTYAPQDGGYADTNTPDLGYHYPLNEDSDYDGLPDWWELKYFGGYGQTGGGDYDGDGINNLQEYLNGTDPTDFYNGVLPNLTIVNGNNQSGMPNTLLLLPLTIRVTDTNGASLTNAPITFAVTQGGAQIATATNGTFSSSVSLRSGINGKAAVFMLLPSTLDTSISATATAWSGITSNQVAFAETTFTGLKLWLRADAGITNSSVNTWFDQTTNHNDANQGSGPNRPLLVANVLNGKPVVRFNASSSQYFNLPNVLVGTTQAEAVVVLKVATNVPAVTRALWKFGTYGATTTYPNTSGQINDDFGNNAMRFVGVPAQPLNQYHVYEVASGPNLWSTWVNGILQTTSTANTYASNSTPTLGLSSSFYFDGDIAEVLIFSRVLSSDERNTIATYLNAKYAVTPAPTAPTNLMATAISASQISLTWDYPQVTVATSFKVERKTGASGTYAQVALLPDSRSYIDTNLTAGTQYYYRVKASNYGGDSDYSNETNATTLASGTDVPLGNLNLWLKSDSGLILQTVNKTLQRWVDQSGRTNDATQASLTIEPLLVTNVLNGRPVVRFNATGSQYLSLPNVLVGTTQVEAVVVLKVATNVPAVTRALWKFGTYGATTTYPDTSGQINEDFGNTSMRFVGIPAQPLNQYHIYEVASGPNLWSTWINGILQTTSSANTYAIDTTPTLGVSSSFYFDGDIAEVLIFNRVLSSDERNTIASYLNAKYAVTPVPAAPTNLMATAISASQISLTWDYPQVTVATSIAVERKTGAGGTYAQVALVRDARSYIDTNLTASTQYYYRVKASTYAGNSGYSNETNATTLASGADVPLGNLNLWLKSDSGLILQTVNKTLQRWVDQSGRTNDATQASNPNEPLLVTNVLNGKPVVRFGASSSQYFNLPNVLVGTTQAEAVVVLKVATNVPAVTRSLWKFGTYGATTSYPNSSGQINDDFGNNAMRFVGVPAQPLNQYHVYDVASAPNLWSAWVNGILQTTSTANTYASNSAPTLGYGTAYFDGDIAEVLIFNRTLSSDERNTINNYLNAKYVVTPVPVAPTNLTATAISASQVSLTWDYPQVTVATSYKVERKTGVAGTYAQVALLPDARSYIDTNLTAGTQYYYRVKASNYGGDSDYSNETNATTLASGADVPLGNLNLWLKSDSGLILQTVNKTLQRWVDQSGRTNDATQASNPNEPLLVTNVLNGKPVVRFNASSSQYFNLPNVLVGTTQAEAVVVLKVATNVPAVTRSLWKFGTYGATTSYPNSSGQINDDFGNTSMRFVGIPAQPLNQYHVYEVASGPNLWSAWVNGILQTTSTANTYASNSAPTLGYGTAYFDGDVAEVLIFNRVLSSDERNTIATYLNAKYAVTPVPTAPTNLMATAISASQISLTWDYPQVTVATSYKVERKTGVAGTYAQVALLPDARSYIDTNLTAGTQYYYRVKASNYGGDSDYSNETNATTLASGADVPLGNLNLWLKSDSGLILQTVNKTLQRWVDQSGRTNDATQASNPNEPLLVTNVLNGKPVVRFGASSSQYFNLPNVLVGTTQAEAVVVLKVATNVPAVTRSLWKFGTYGATTSYPNSSGQINDDFGNNAMRFVGVPAQPLNQYHVYDVASAPNLWSAWVNGILQTTSTANTYASNSAPTLGYGTAYFDGDIAEVLIFNRALSSAERDSLNQYLNSRYSGILAPVITSPPTNVTVIQGQSATFSVGVIGITPFGYQWLFNSTPIANATNSTLPLSNIQASDGGNYSVVVTNAYGAATSSLATLTVILPPLITAQPTNTTATWGANTSFSVTATGTLPLYYQWYGKTYGLLANATNATLNIVNVQPMNLDTYFVVITNAGGAVTSAVATLSPSVATYVAPLGPLTNYTFSGENTYFINGTIGLYGTTTIEGGTVIKFETNSTLSVQGPLLCQTTSYRPAILTSKNDDTVGLAILGSTSNPSVAGQTAFLAGGVGQTNDYRNLRITFAGVGIVAFSNINVWDSQFVQCGTAIGSSGDGKVVMRNLLITQSSNCVSTAGSVSVENLTADQVQAFCAVTYAGANVTNSILTAVTNQTGLNLFASSSASNGSGIYRSVGAANYYLISGCTERNGGTTNINPILLSGLRQKTTYPPSVLTNLILADTVLGSTVQRDTDTPDQGYHYSAIDYLSSCVVSNATLFVSNGAVLAFPNAPAVALQENGQLVSQGAANLRNYFIHYSLVQEQPISLWGYASVSGATLFETYHNDTNRNPSITLRFTTVNGPVGAIYALRTLPGTEAVNVLSLRDNEVYASGANIVGLSLDPASSMNLQNNLFHDGRTAVASFGTNSAYNNLFFGSTNDSAQFQKLGTNSLTMKDNAFDIGTAYLDGDDSTNAFLNTTVVTSTIQTGDIVTNLSWVAGVLGNYYQATNSPLINKGSRTADLAALYHYAVTTNGVKETNSIVDMGYHYVAADINGNPLDTDGDGILDYIEDANGDGNAANDATSWQSYNSPNSLSGTATIQVFTPLK